MLHISGRSRRGLRVFGRFTAKGPALTVESPNLEVSRRGLLPALGRRARWIR